MPVWAGEGVFFSVPLAGKECRSGVNLTLPKKDKQAAGFTPNLHKTTHGFIPFRHAGVSLLRISTLFIKCYFTLDTRSLSLFPW